MYLLVAVIILVVVGGVYLLVRKSKSDQLEDQSQNVQAEKSKPAETAADSDQGSEAANYNDDEYECRCNVPGGSCTWK